MLALTGGKKVFIKTYGWVWPSSTFQQKSNEKGKDEYQFFCRFCDCFWNGAETTINYITALLHTDRKAYTIKGLLSSCNFEEAKSSYTVTGLTKCGKKNKRHINETTSSIQSCKIHYTSNNSKRYWD